MPKARLNQGASNRSAPAAPEVPTDFVGLRNFITSPTIGGRPLDIPVMLPSASGSDDTATINAILARSGGQRVRGQSGASYRISAPLVLPSGGNVDVDMTGCTVTLIAGSQCNIIQNAAFTATRSFSDVATTATSTTITSAATAAFTPGDVGRAISIYGAGAAGIRLNTSITGYTSATQVTIGVAASVTLANGCGSIGVRDSEITIRGGTWVRGTGNQLQNGLFAHSLLFRHVDGLRIRDINAVSRDGKYFVSLGDVYNFSVERIVLDVGSDGIHLNGMCFYGNVASVLGAAGDDMVAITTNDTAAGYPATGDITGPVTDVTFQDVHYTALNGTPSAAAVNVYGDPLNIHGASRIAINRCSHSASDYQFSVGIQGRVTDISVANCSGAILSSTQPGTTAVTQAGIRIDNHSFTPTVSAPLLFQANPGAGQLTITDVSLRDITFGAMAASGTAICCTIAPGCTVGTLRMDAVTIVGAATRMAYVYGAATTVDAILLSRVKYDGVDFSAATLLTVGTSSSINRLMVSGAVLTNLNCMFNIGQSPALNVSTINVRYSALNSAKFSTCAVTWRSSGIEGTAVPTLASGATLRSQGTISVDVSLLTKSAGDTAVNTNAAVAPFVTGPAICDGASWRSTVTGSVRTGTATLAAGTVTVSDAAVTANSVIRLAGKTVGGTGGALFISARSAGVSFTISSTSVVDTGVVQYDVLAY